MYYKTKENRYRIAGGEIQLYNDLTDEENIEDLKPFTFSNDHFLTYKDFVIIGVNFKPEYYSDGDNNDPDFSGVDGIDAEITELKTYWTNGVSEEVSGISNRYVESYPREREWHDLYEFIEQINTNELTSDELFNKEHLFIITLYKLSPRFENADLSNSNVVINMDVKFSDDDMVYLKGKR